MQTSAVPAARAAPLHSLSLSFVKTDDIQFYVQCKTDNNCRNLRRLPGVKKKRKKKKRKDDKSIN